MKPGSSNTHLIQDTVTTPSVSLGRTQRMLYEYKELLGLGGISGTLPIYNHCQTLKPSVKLVLEKAGANPLPQSRVTPKCPTQAEILPQSATSFSAGA